MCVPSTCCVGGGSLPVCPSVDPVVHVCLSTKGTVGDGPSRVGQVFRQEDPGSSSHFFCDGLSPRPYPNFRGPVRLSEVVVHPRPLRWTDGATRSDVVFVEVYSPPFTGGEPKGTGRKPGVVHGPTRVGTSSGLSRSLDTVVVSPRRGDFIKSVVQDPDLFSIGPVCRGAPVQGFGSRERCGNVGG